MASKKRARASAPWERPAPKRARKRPTKLSPAGKQRARARARRAGRSYPNLVDNMREAGRVKARKRPLKKKTAKKRKRATVSRASRG